MPYRPPKPGLRFIAALLLLVLAVAIPALVGQSNHAATMLASGAWRLHSRVPLGFEALVLQPSRIPVYVVASAEVPEFEGWTLTERREKLVLLDSSSRPVQTLPKSMTFRFTVGTRDKVVDSNPMSVECTKTLNDFLLDMHFHLQVFRGIEMRALEPVKTSMIGVPADEASDERIYRSTFNLEDVRPEDRIVLLITDSSGKRITKFHLEFL
jgi:hypothetical protein